MPIDTKTFPYEILIRFSEGAAHQKNRLGEFEGAHFIERARMVDSETGAIVAVPTGEEVDRAINLPREKVVEYIGKQFVDFEAQNRALQERLDAVVADALSETISQREDAIAEMSAALEKANDKLNKAASALTGG